MENKEFNIESREETFRVAKISPIDLLAITSQLNLETFEQSKTTITFCLEHLQVKQGDLWMPVKAPGKDVYMPVGIEEDMSALNELYMYVMQEVIIKAFTKSSK